MAQEEVRPLFSGVAYLDLGFVRGYLISLGRATSFPGQLQSTIDVTQLLRATRQGTLSLSRTDPASTLKLGNQ